MRKRKGAHELPDPLLYWMEQPVCLEWADKEGEESSPRQQWSAGSPLGMVGALVGTVCSVLFPKGRSRRG